MKKFILGIFLLLFSIIPVLANSEATVMPSQTGIIQNVTYVELEQEVASVKQIAEIKLLKGELKNQTITVDNIFTGNPLFDINLKKGMKVILHVEKTDNGLEFSVEDIHRSNMLQVLSAIFCGLLIYVGRKKGLYSLISIAITAALILYGLSPLILFGINPIVATIIISLLSTAATMYLVGGFNKKSTAATLGCVLSIIFAGLLSMLTVKIAHLNGFSSENSSFLYASHPELNFVAITVSTMILATLGAVMDVAMSIASTINEIHSLDNTKTVSELFKSGMNVGRDIIGTMANTLILVYMGGALPLILLASNIDLTKFLNLNQVVTEISAALIGSSAIIICVPITAIVASELIKKIPQKVELNRIDI